MLFRSNTENFIGYTENPDQATLDWRIRNLASQAQLSDDSNCPDVSFNYIITSKSPVTGTTISYVITIDGTITSFTLDFGDGTTETTALTGTHTYPANFNVDPVLTVQNSTCSKVITGVERENPRRNDLQTPPVITPNPTIIIPTIPNFPTLNCPPPSVVPFEFTPPPIVIPRLGDFPSIITFGTNISIPSIIYSIYLLILVSENVTRFEMTK